jgi:hypothetical protein
MTVASMNTSSHYWQQNLVHEQSNETIYCTANNTFFFTTIDKVFYYVASVLTTCFGPYIIELI